MGRGRGGGLCDAGGNIVTPCSLCICRGSLSRSILEAGPRISSPGSMQLWLLHNVMWRLPLGFRDRGTHGAYDAHLQ